MSENVNRQKTVEVLMSCMHQDGFDIAYRTKIDSDVLIVNQCDKDAYEEITVNGHTWRMIYTTERGLARSRNMALENSCPISSSFSVVLCPFPLKYLQYSCVKMACTTKKSLAVGHISCLQIDPKQ